MRRRSARGNSRNACLCIEKETLGGTCLNWGCIPTKALLDDGAFIRKLRLHAAEHGVTYKDLTVDYSKLVARSRAIAEKLSKGIEHLFRKYEVKKESGVGQLLGPHKVKITSPQGTKEVTAEHIIIATGSRATPLPGVAFDGKKMITSREAMNLPKQPKKLAIIGAGAIGCEFADFYNAIGTEVVIVEMMDHLLPIEDEDVSILLERIFAKREIDVRVKTKTEKVEVTPDGREADAFRRQGGSGGGGCGAGGDRRDRQHRGPGGAGVGLELVKGRVRGESAVSDESRKCLGGGGLPERELGRAGRAFRRPASRSGARGPSRGGACRRADRRE